MQGAPIPASLKCYCSRNAAFYLSFISVFNYYHVVYSIGLKKLLQESASIADVSSLFQKQTEWLTNEKIDLVLNETLNERSVKA